MDTDISFVVHPMLLLLYICDWMWSQNLNLRQRCLIPFMHTNHLLGRYMQLPDPVWYLILGHAGSRCDPTAVFLLEDTQCLGPVREAGRRSEVAARHFMSLTAHLGIRIVEEVWLACWTWRYRVYLVSDWRKLQTLNPNTTSAFQTESKCSVSINRKMPWILQLLLRWPLGLK